MQFNSIEFLTFFAFVFTCYWFLPHKWQNRFLLAVSYLFYCSWNWKFLSLILVSTFVDYFCGIYIHGSKEDKRKNLILLFSLITNLGILGFFKYANFFVAEASDLLTIVGFQPNISTLNIILPVGISFYTFQTMSYTIDIYRRKMKPTRNFPDFALFVAFFPQLVAGPIERAINLLPQITKQRVFEYSSVVSGLRLAAWGMFKKVIIATQRIFNK